MKANIQFGSSRAVVGDDVVTLHVALHSSAERVRVALVERSPRYGMDGDGVERSVLLMEHYCRLDAEAVLRSIREAVRRARKERGVSLAKGFLWRTAWTLDVEGVSLKKCADALAAVLDYSRGA